MFFRKPTALLRGHSAPIFFLLIAEEENRIFSLSTDKCIKVMFNLMKRQFPLLMLFCAAHLNFGTPEINFSFGTNEKLNHFRCLNMYAHYSFRSEMVLYLTDILSKIMEGNSISSKFLLPRMRQNKQNIKNIVI